MFVIVLASLFGVFGALLSISFAYVVGGIFGFYLLRRHINIDMSLSLSFKSSLNENKKLVKKIQALVKKLKKEAKIIYK